jgi:AGZA family xanthine/uracil permease-like MFS transporter
MDFVDTIGTLIGLSVRANLLDEHGQLPEMEKPMLADALATVVGALLGTTTAGTYIESAAGIEEGGRTGLTAVVVALLFLAAIFFEPFLTAVPAQAYGPALIIVGMLMMSPITRIDFADYTEVIPAFGIVTLMSFTYNIGIGLTAGFVLYPLFKLIGGRPREIHPGLLVLCALSLLFYIFYPY